jgi:hypothetical protein
MGVLLRDDWSVVTDVSGDVDSPIFRVRRSTKSLLGLLDFLPPTYFLLEPWLFIL